MYLSGFQRSFQRHLHEKGSLINILKDNEFSKSREVLAAKRKNLVRQGNGNCPNATRELTEAEEDALFENIPVNELDLLLSKFFISVRKQEQLSKCLHSPTNPTSGFFCKFEGCTFNINVFCGDQSKIARLNEN